MKWVGVFMIVLASNLWAIGQDRKELQLTKHILTIGYQPAFQFSEDNPRIGGAVHGLNIGYQYEENFTKYSDDVNWSVGFGYATLGRSGDSSAHRIIHNLSIPFQVDVRVVPGYKSFLFGGLHSFVRIREVITGPANHSIRREASSNYFDLIPYLGYMYKSDRFRFGLQAGRSLLPQTYGSFNEYYLFHFGYHL